MSDNYVANDFAEIAKTLAKLKEERQTSLERDPDKIANTVSDIPTDIDIDYSGWCF